MSICSTVGINILFYFWWEVLQIFGKYCYFYLNIPIENDFQLATLLEYAPY